MYDDSPNGPSPGQPIPGAALHRLTSWVETGETPAGAADPAETSEQRRQGLLTAIAEQRQAVGTHYLPPGVQDAVGGGDFSLLRRPEDLVGVPLFHEVAGDVHHVLGVILSILREPVKDNPLNRPGKRLF